MSLDGSFLLSTVMDPFYCPRLHDTGLQCNSDDYCTMNLKFPDGMVGTIILNTRSSGFSQEIGVFGSAGEMSSYPCRFRKFVKDFNAFDAFPKYQFSFYAKVLTISAVTCGVGDVMCQGRLEVTTALDDVHTGTTLFGYPAGKKHILYT